MNNVGEQLNLVINTLSSKLGVVADKLFPILIKQSYVEGFLSIFELLFGIAFCLLPYWFYKYVTKKDEDGECISECWEDSWVAYWIFTIIICFIGIIMVIGNFSDIVTAFYNPEYFAIKRLFSDINLQK